MSPVDLQAAADGSALDLAGGETDNAGSLTRTFTTAPDPGDNTVEVTVPGLPPRTLVVPTRRLSRMTIRPERAELVAGGTLIFEAIGFDDNGGELGVRPQWTLAGDIGALAPSGTFTAGTAGRGRVRAEAGGVVASSPLAVVAGPPFRIEVRPAEVRVESGEAVTLRAVVRDAGGNEVALDPGDPDAIVQWSLTRDVGDLDARGVMTARRVGEAAVVAAAGDLRGEARVAVTAGPLVTIAVVPRNPTVASGTEQQFRAVGQDAGGNEVPLAPAWSLSAAVGELDDTGLFRAVRAGTARLVVASGRVAASTVIEVVPGPLESIAVSPAQAEVPAGTTVAFRGRRTRCGRERGGHRTGLGAVVGRRAARPGRCADRGAGRTGAGGRAVGRGERHGGRASGHRRADQSRRGPAHRHRGGRIVAAVRGDRGRRCGQPVDGRAGVEPVGGRGAYRRRRHVRGHRRRRGHAGGGDGGSVGRGGDSGHSRTPGLDRGDPAAARHHVRLGAGVRGRGPGCGAGTSGR